MPKFIVHHRKSDGAVISVETSGADAPKPISDDFDYAVVEAASLRDVLQGGAGAADIVVKAGKVQTRTDRAAARKAARQKAQASASVVAEAQNLSLQEFLALTAAQKWTLVWKVIQTLDEPTSAPEA